MPTNLRRDVRVCSRTFFSVAASDSTCCICWAWYCYIRVDTGGELLSDFRVSVDIVRVGEDFCRVVGVVLGFLLGFLLVFESLFLFVDLGTKFLLTGFGVFASGV